MIWILTLLMFVISCEKEVGSGSDSSKPKPTATPEPATSPKDETLDNTADSSPKTVEPDDDGWRLIPFEGTLDEGIRVNSGSYVSVDFDDHDIVMHNQLDLKLSNCGDIKLVGTKKRGVAILDSGTIQTTVGELTAIFLYRPNGAITAPSTSSCTLIAEVIKREDGEVRESKKKTFKIREGATKIIQSTTAEETPKPYFALDSDGDVTLSLDTQGAITDDDLLIEIYKESEEGQFVFVGSALEIGFRNRYGYLKGKVDEVKVCGITIHVYKKGNLYCGPDLNNKQYLSSLSEN